MPGVHRAEPLRQVVVASHGEPGARGIVDAAIGGGQCGEQRADAQEHHQEGRAREAARVEQRNTGLAQIFPRHQPGADIPGERRRDQQRDDARHGAEGQGACGRADFLRRLRGALDAEIVPEAEMHGRHHADPAIGKGRVSRHQLGVAQRRILADGGAEEEQDDGDEGNRRDDEVEVQRGQHAPVVEPGEEHDGQNDEGPLVDPRVTRHVRHRVDEEADGDGVARFQHGVGEHQVEADVEGHERAHDVLGLGVLPAGGGDRRGDLGVDHRDAGVEEAREPAGDECRIGAALAHAEVPAHVFADEHDAHTQRPDMGRAEDAEEADPLDLRGGRLIDVCHAAPPRPCASR